MELSAIVEACNVVARTVQSDERYGHTTALRVTVDSQRIVDRRFAGNDPADVFSITKTVVALLVGVAVERGEVTDLDARIGDVLPRWADSLGLQTWRHLLTMTRGAAVDRQWDVDHVMALDRDWVGHLARAPQVLPAGSRFAYDNGAAHLLAAALVAVSGTSLQDYADQHLFAPLRIEDWEWPRDPDGVALGFGHLRLTVDGLQRIGQLLLHRGRWAGRALVGGDYLDAMIRPWSSGGPPEGLPYGYLLWVDEPVGYLAAGWAGQALVVMPGPRAVVVVTGDPRFLPGPPPRDPLAPGWRPALELVRQHVLPVLMRR